MDKSINISTKTSMNTTCDSETIQKFKFDNQILIKRLSEYKKAEKGAI